MDLLFVETVSCNTLAQLESVYNKLLEALEKYKKIMNGKFNYYIEPDYETLEIDISSEFIDAPDNIINEIINDNTERDPRLN